MMNGGRQEKVDAGREKFAAYQKRKKKSLHHRDGVQEKDDTPAETQLSDTSVGGLEESVCSSPSSIISMSEPGSNLVQELKAKVRELEDIISGQQAALEAVRRSSLEQQTDCKTQLESYINRLREYEGAVEERNGVIEQLTASLHAELMARRALQQQGDHLAQEVSLLQRQLKATSELVQGHHWDTGVRPDEFLALQNKVLMLEASLEQMEEVKSQLTVKGLELEKTTQELREQKSRSAQEVQRLMKEVELIQQRAATSALEHKRKLTEMEENFGLQLRMKEEFRRQAEEEKHLLKVAHEEELSALHQQYLSRPEHLDGRVESKENGNERSANYYELKQHVFRLTLQLESSSRKLEETLEVNLSLREAISKAQYNFEEELATIKKQSLKEAQTLQHNIDDVRKELENAVLNNQRLSEELDKERDGHKQDVGALNMQLRESYERQQNLTAQLQESGQAKQLQEESYKQVIESLNERLREATEAEERTPDVVMAHVENFKAESLKYKEQVDTLNVRLQESMKNSQAHEKLLSDKEAKLVVLNGELDKVKTLLDLVTESESSLRQQIDSLNKELQEAIKFKANAEYYKLQNNELNSKLKELNNVLSFREQRISEYEMEVTVLNSKLEEFKDFKIQAESYKEKIRNLNAEAEELLTYKDKAEALQSEMDVLKNKLSNLLNIFSDTEAATIYSEEHSLSKREVEESDFGANKIELLIMKFSYVLKQREEEAVSYQMKIENLNSKLEENSQAAEKQACEWEERIAVYRERLDSLSSKVYVVEEEQRTEVSRLQSAHQEELVTLKASYDEIMVALKMELASQKEHYDKELEQRKCAFELEMVRLKEAHNMKLVELDETYKSQLTLQSQEIQLLEGHVKGLSQEIREKSTHLESLQEKLKLLEKYETKISQLEHEREERKSVEWSTDTNELELCKQQIDVLKSRLEEASVSEQKHIETVTTCQLQVESYKQQVELLDSRCVDELAASQQVIDELQDQLMSNCVAEQELEELRRQLAARDEEAVSLRNQIESLTAALEDKKVCEKNQYRKLPAAEAQLLELHTSLDNSVAKVKDLTACLDENVKEMESLQEKVNLLELEVKVYKEKETSLHNKAVERMHNQTCTKCELQNSVEYKMAKIKDENEELKKLLSKGKLKEEQLIADLAKQQSDITALNNKILKLEQDMGTVELKTEVEELIVDKLKLESLLEGKKELISGIQQQQGGVLANMQEMTVQCLKTSSLLAAKEELQSACTERIVELESSLEQANKDNSQLTLKVMKAKELLKRLKEEKNKTTVKNSELEAECERLRTEGEKAKKWKELVSRLEQESEQLKTLLKSSVESTASVKSLQDKFVPSRTEEHNKEVHELLVKLETTTVELEQLKLQLSTTEETLVSLRMEVKAGQELQAVLQNRLSDSLGQNNMVEMLVLELSGQTKEVVILKEKLQLAESRYKAMVAAKEKYEQELNEVWKVQKNMEDKLAETREELVSLKAEEERFSKQVVQRPSELLDDPVVEFSKDLQQEKALELTDEWEEQSVLSWDDVLSDYERELLGQLAAYHEQHAGLAELLGSSGILQETMYQQKQQLLKKLQEKSCVDSRLEEQRILYRNAQRKLQALEQQLLEKDNIQKELARQKRLLQQDLREIEDRLHNQERALSAQRLALEAEICARDLRIRHWQLQARATKAASSMVDEAQEERLHDLRAQLDDAHTRAVESLRMHFQEQLVVREGCLSSQLRSVLRIPREQMPSIVELISSELQQQSSELGGSKSAEAIMKFAEKAAAEIVHKFETELEVAVETQHSTPEEQKLGQMKDSQLATADKCGGVLLAVQDSLCWEYASALKAVAHAWQVRYERELIATVSALKETWAREEMAHRSGETDAVATCQNEAKALLAAQEQFVSALEGVQAEVVGFHRDSVVKLREEMQSEHERMLEKVDQMRSAVSGLQAHMEQTSQVSPLQDHMEKLRHELETKHAKEMEELRQYFEQKCADVEKRYSEEVFSQHSRKLSGSSAGSAEELTTDYFAGGDQGQRVPALTHICDSYSVEPSYKDLDEHYRTVYERRLLEYRDQLEAVKVSLEQKYHSEMTALRSHYEQLIQNSSHELKSAEPIYSEGTLIKQHERKLEDVEEYFTENIIDELSRMSSEVAIDKVCLEVRMQEEVRKELDERHSRMVDASTETQLATECVTATERDDTVQLCNELDVHWYVSDGKDTNFASVLELLRKKVKGTAIIGCLDRLGALHDKELNTLLSAVQEQAGMFELEHEAWEQRLHEQVEQARCDMVATLHHHLQTVISESEKSPGPVPQELATLQERFVGPLQREVNRLKQELTALKTQEGKHSLVEQNGTHVSVEILTKERDDLRHALAVLRCVVRELLDYCARCEDELNGTLVEELSPADRVHLSPDATALASFVQDDSLSSDASVISTHFRGELNRCLARLHLEASSVLALSRNLAGGKELVGEGLCELVQPTRRLHVKDPARRSLSEPSSSPVKLLDEMRQEKDRISEEARREKEDLQQQVEAADKQLRSTRQFLEEQTAECEQEREEFAREVAALQGQLRDRERDRAEHQRLLKEVECLDHQAKETTAHLAESEAARARIQTDLETAAEKISTLREIIVELEESVENRAANEENLKQRLTALESLLHQQDDSHRQLASELESLREESGQVQLAEHISALEEQLCRHRLHVEQFQSGSGAVRRMKAQIQELEAAVGKKARELESLHCVVPSNGSPISSPLSEDTSIREQLEVMRCSTPDHGQRETPSPVPLPLEELQRLQEKLQRLCRAEESALKRVADLEMELCSMHHREEEVAAERDVLQRQTEEQLLKISSLQARLDEQRRAVDSAHWLAVSELRSELLERTDEIHSLRDACDASHKEVKELRNLLEQARQQAAVQETEMMSLLERVQSNSQEHVDQHTVTNTEEGAVSVMDALLADAREEHCSLQEELVHLKKKCRQLQWLLSCHQNLSLTPHQQQQLSTLLQEVTLSPQSSDLESDEQPGKWPNNLYPQQPRLVAEEVFREAPELSLSYSLPDAFQEQIPGPASEVQQSRTDKDQQLKELREQCALLQNLKQENCELIQQVAELHNSCAALKNLQAENVVLMQEVEALKAKCTAVQQEKSVLEQQIKDLTAQCASVDSVQQEKYLLLEEIKALTCKCSLSENFKLENVALAKQVEELQSKYVALEVVQAENALLLEEVDKLRHECSASKKIEEENSKISKQAEILQTECLRLRNSEQEKISLVEKINCLNAKCLVVDCLEEENVSQAQKIVELQDLCSNLDNLQEENRVLSKKVGKLTDECFTMKKLQEENVCLSREVKDLREQCCIAKNLQLENLSMSQKVKDLETQCSIVNDLQEENKLLLQKIQKLQDEFLLLKKLQEENRSLAQTIEELQNGGSFVKKLQEENLSLCQRVKDLHAECAVTGGNMSHENAVLTQKLEELEAQCLLVAELQKDNASLLQQVHELSIKCKFLEKSHYEDDIQAVLSAHQDQEQNILKLQEEKKMLQEAYLKVLQDMDNKQGSLDELSGQLQRELEESEKLDLSLLERLTSSDEDVPAVEMLEPTLVIILRKILGSGISVLTFKELSLLHQHVCSATAAVMVQDDSRQSQMVVCDSLDPQARSKVSQLESLLSRERHLVSELRSALNSERLHAQELANHVRLQSQLLADMQIQQTSIQSSIGRYTDLIEIERNKTLTLEDKLASERSSNRQLQSALEGEKQKIRSIRIQDCSLLESMRQQLDMALENEGKLHHQLQQGTLETNAALQLRCTELEARVLQLEEELSQQREAAVHHKQVDTEKSAAILLGQLEAVEANLLSLIRDSVHEDDDSDRDLRQRITGLKERLQGLSTAHIPDNLEERLAPLRQREQQLLEELGAAQRQAGELRTALVVRDQRLAASKNQLATLGKELSASRSREAELERKLTLEGSCKSQGCLVSTLLHDEGIREGGVKAVRAGRGREDTVVLTAATVAHSAGFTARPERPTCSQGSIADAANGTDSKETEWLQEQIKVLQEREKINHAAWRDQKAALEEALAAARSHSHMSNGEPLQLSHDMEERMTHLFGKYLRSESYRKSLVWQKKYLLVALSGYQDCQATTLSQLALIAGHMPTKTRPSPRRRFRVAVVTVIVIQRMRYLVHRWRHSRRIGKSVIVSRPFCECVGPGTHLSYYATRKKWGQSPQYPPSRDEGALWHSSGYHRPWRLGENGCVTLLEPSSVAQYAVRCDNLQRQLGLATST